jgi:hypothetical protein
MHLTFFILVISLMEERMFHMDILCTTLKEINIKRFVQSAELSFEKVIFDRKAVIFPIFAMQLYFLFYICHLNNIIHYWGSYATP